MTLYEFNQLDETEQIEAVWDSVLIGTYKDEVYLFTCYQKDDFYIETKRHIKYDVLHWLRSFRNPDQLAPYLEQMKIDIK